MVEPLQAGLTGASLASRMLALLGKQHGLLTRLDELSRRQMALVETGDAERLLELMGERQEVISRLQESSELLEPLRPAWAEAGPRLPGAVQGAVMNVVEAVATLLESIGKRDGEAMRALAKRREEVAAALLRVDRGRGALVAYGGGSRGGASLQDREA
jgi:hypothetical protein